MSLLDALLLDPQRIDVWLAARKDDVSGSGTQQDPYNASVRLETAASGTATITVFANSGQDATITAVNTFATGDKVLVSGATDPAFNGVFILTNATGSNFTYRMNATPAVTTSSSPKAIKVLEFRFDTVMADPTKVGANTSVHLGPGIFETAGYYDGGSVWDPPVGLQLTGSGIDVTTLHIVNAATATRIVYAVGHSLSSTALKDFFELSSMTIDCNFRGHSGTLVAAGAARIQGNHSRVVRVKVKNWGNKMGGASYVIGMITGNGTSNPPSVTNCGIQDCIVISPAVGSTSRILILHVGYSEAPGGTKANGVDPYIRNCFVDSGQAVPLPNTANDQLFGGLSMAWCKGGVVEGNQISNTFHGGPYNTLGATDLTIRNNVYRNVAAGPNFQISPPSSTVVAIDNLVIEGNTIELTTSTVNPLSGIGTRYAMGVIAYNNGSSDKSFGNVVIRNNKIRYLAGADPTVQLGSGTLIFGAKNLLVRENILDLVENPPPVSVKSNLTNKTCGAVQYFENRSNAGRLIQGYSEDTPNRFYTELATDADDAFILSLLKRS